MIGFFDTELGRVQISPAIVRRFIIREVAKTHNFRFPGVKPGEDVSRKTSEKFIRINFVEGNVEITLTLSVEFGARIIKEARELQGKIARSIQLGAGINVRHVAVNVESVFEHPKMEEPLLIEHESDEAVVVN
ncbi:MAG: Asp23/Gls24 family envelope stress response protein [bacterium]|nr:Asp23/Gls24 family envelope stress response protein [bacterium]